MYIKIYCVDLNIMNESIIESITLLLIQKHAALLLKLTLSIGYFEFFPPLLNVLPPPPPFFLEGGDGYWIICAYDDQSPIKILLFCFSLFVFFCFLSIMKFCYLDISVVILRIQRIKKR